MQGIWCRIAAAAVLFCLVRSTLEADAPNRVWQTGEIISIKEDALADGNSLAYVYSLRAKDFTYVAVFSSPLKAYIHATVKFTVEKRTLCVQDLDGKSRTAAMVEQHENSRH
ncbi:MAG TPA: hypothetical protein VGH38_35950 [Bryobacteraceae bacterium]|jgi:hypothetical protein